MKLAEMAGRLGCTLEGDPNLEVYRVAPLDEAGPTDLTFFSNPKYAAKLKTTRAGAVIVPLDAPPLASNVLKSENPYLAFAKAVEIFYQPPASQPGIHPTAQISPSASIGDQPSIGPFCVIGDNVRLGDHAVLQAFVALYAGCKIGHHFYAHSHCAVREHCEIGDHVTLQNGVVIGADGFGFAKTRDGTYYKIVQSGRVVLEDWVEVQANATIDRAAIGETRIKRGAKIDNLVQVGHGSKVGENTLLCSQVGLAGSTEVGRDVILTGQVGVAGHCKIGDGVVATAQTGIPSDVEAGKVVSGYPAIDNRTWLKAAALFARLPELNKTVRELKQQVSKILGSHS
ncbi:MAG: UDP-3-O-(3-hydroxymyristoyl)glucosamine N-acyltransferase [Acidobacteriota bacterium]